jgi:hypothetical protein
MIRPRDPAQDSGACGNGRILRESGPLDLTAATTPSAKNSLYYDRKYARVL